MKNDVILNITKSLNGKFVYASSYSVYTIAQDLKKNKSIKFCSDKISELKTEIVDKIDCGILSIIEIDCSIFHDSKEVISKQHKKFNEYSIIIFGVSSNSTFKNQHTFSEIREISMIDIQFLDDFILTMKSTEIRSLNLRFNHHFGAGSDFYFGENKVFLSDSIKKGVRVLWVPYYIAIRKYYCLNTIDAVINSRESIGAILCNMYGFDYIVRYITYSLNNLARNETNTMIMNDRISFNLTSFLNGAYKYNNVSNLIQNDLYGKHER